MAPGAPGDHANFAKLSVRPYPYEPDDPVICEIAEPEDWAELVNRHPLVRKRDPDFWEYWLGAQRQGSRRHRTPFVLVNWADVAKEYDAVHVTPRGYLLSAWAPIATEYGLTTLAGWGPDLTPVGCAEPIPPRVGQ